MFLLFSLIDWKNKIKIKIWFRELLKFAQKLAILNESFTVLYIGNHAINVIYGVIYYMYFNLNNFN